MQITAYDLAQRFIGIKEVSGPTANPTVLAMLRLDNQWPQDDTVPWCSAFVNYIAWLLRLPRSKSLAARSWMQVGTPIKLQDAVPGFDIVVLSRDGGGHVGFFGGLEDGHVLMLGGNQGDTVCVESFPVERVIAVRSLLV